MDNFSKLAVLEERVEHIKSKIEKLEDNIETIYRELDTYKKDLQDAIYQCKGIVNQVAEVYSEFTKLDSIVSSTVVKVEECEKDRSNTIYNFIKSNPVRAIQITALVLLIAFGILFMNVHTFQEYILRLLRVT